MHRPIITSLSRSTQSAWRTHVTCVTQPTLVALTALLQLIQLNPLPCLQLWKMFSLSANLMHLITSLSGWCSWGFKTGVVQTCSCCASLTLLFITLTSHRWLCASKTCFSAFVQSTQACGCISSLVKQFARQLPMRSRIQSNFLAQCGAWILVR